MGRPHRVEPDVVELSTLNRQTLFHDGDLGRPKLDAALTALRALNPDTEVTGERREVRGPPSPCPSTSPSSCAPCAAWDRNTAWPATPTR